MELSKKRGDRYDGYRVKNVEPFFLIIPYVMKTRVDSQVYFFDEIDITAAEQFVRAHQEDIPGLKLFHVIIAAALRTYSQRPYLNRFVMSSKIYARKEIPVSMIIKKQITAKGDETLVKPVFQPDVTLHDVVKRFNELVEENKAVVKQNGTDNTAKLIGHLPHWLVKSVINLLMWMDRCNFMPKIINKVSPFHTGLFLTNVGSIGIEPIYHHIYEFGTTSLFIAIGKKHVTLKPDEDDPTVMKRRKSIGFKLVADERICDGQYFAESCKIMLNLIKRPERLLEKPEFIYVDDGINKLFERKIIDEETGKKTKQTFKLGDKYRLH